MTTAGEYRDMSEAAERAVLDNPALRLAAANLAAALGGNGVNGRVPIGSKLKIVDSGQEVGPEEFLPPNYRRHLPMARQVIGLTFLAAQGDAFGAPVGESPVLGMDEAVERGPNGE